MTEPALDVETADLDSYLSTELAADVVGTEVLHDGLNLSIAISTADEERAYVLRRPNKLRHTDLFIDVDAEYTVLQRLGETDVPAPAPVLYCDDDSVLGDPFLVMTYLDGAVVPLGSDLPERFRTPASRRRVAHLLVDTLADTHTVDADRFDDVCEHQTPLDQVARATERLDEATSVTGLELPTLRSVGEWLERNAPADPGTTLVHGDFRPGNVLFAGTDRPAVGGVLDWETAMLGDPLTELGYLLLRWRDDGDPTPPLDELEARYSNDEVIQELEETNENGLAPFTARSGSLTRRELVARYEAKTGISFDHDRFYRAHAAFMLATVWADLHRYRVDAGDESDWEPHIEYMTLMAERIVAGEFPL